MRASHHFSEAFKNSILLKVLNRKNQTISVICEQENVAISTVYGWLQKRGKMKPMDTKQQKKWSAEEKLRVVNETCHLKGEELGAYLRQIGLHSPMLAEWRQEALQGLRGPTHQPAKPKKDQRDTLIQQLEQELRRKDRALAEASALLILQKKVHLIWDASKEEKN